MSSNFFRQLNWVSLRSFRNAVCISLKKQQTPRSTGKPGCYADKMAMYIQQCETQY